jgi:hypothetical protein
MHNFLDKTSIFNLQTDNQEKSDKDFQKKSKRINQSNSENRECTCHTGKCGCQDDKHTN